MIQQWWCQNLALMSCLCTAVRKCAATGDHQKTTGFVNLGFVNNDRSINSCNIGWAGHVALTQGTREFLETFVQDIKSM